MSPTATDVTLTVIALERVIYRKRSKNTKIEKSMFISIHTDDAAM
jgi:hypothetical protein